MLVEDGIKKGLELGIEQGIEQGIQQGIQLCRELGADYRQTIQKIKTRFHLRDQEAEEAVKRYW